MLIKILPFFYSTGILDMIIIGSKDKDMVIYTFNPFEPTDKKRFQRVEKKTAVNEFFPDKLKDLHGYQYRALYHNDYPKIYDKIHKNGKIAVDGRNAKFLQTVVKHQNAKVSWKFVNDDDRKLAIKEFVDNFNENKADLTLNTGIKFGKKNKNSLREVNTFETDGYCAMLPYPERKSFFSFFLKPFDVWTWIMIMVSVTGLTVVWYFLNKTTRHRNPNSAGYFLFAILAFFVGQGAEFRNHRLLQKVLIQLMIMMTFILGNAYQSVLVSMMAESRYGNQITTIESMSNSEFTFHVDPIFLSMFNSSDQYQTLHEKITGTVEKLRDLNFEKLSAEKIGLILPCNSIDILFLNTKKFFDHKDNAIDFYYKVSEKFYTYYEYFPTAPYSIFTDRLQEYSLRIHESGIKQHWQTMTSFEDMAKVKERESIINEEYFMNLKDMAGAFYFLAIGYSISLMIFVLEFFWKKIEEYARRRLRHLAMRNRVEPQRFAWVD